MPVDDKRLGDLERDVAGIKGDVSGLKFAVTTLAGGTFVGLSVPLP